MSSFFQVREQIVDPCKTGVSMAPQVRKKAAHQQIFFYRHSWPQLSSFRYQTDVAFDSLGRRQRRNIFSSQPELSWPDGQNSRDRVQSARLSCAVGADDAGELALGNGN